MGSKKLTKVLAAALLTGAMVMAVPAAAMAYTAVPAGTTANSAIPTVSGLKIKWDKGTPYVVWTPLAADKDIRIEYSTDSSFPDTDVTDYIWANGADGQASLYFAEAGKTYYIRAVVVDYTVASGSYYGAYTAPVTYTEEVPEAIVAESSTTSTTVSFRFNNSDVTGYEISRKIGGKWKVVANVNDNVYTDKNLKSYTTYSYRIRAYVYNTDTKTKTYSSKYTLLSKTTWGSALQVKATASSTTKVKLTWKKVTGATGYKIYRAVGSSNSTYSTKGQDTSFTNYRLIKTITKAKTVSYTNSGLTAGQTYSYKVVAYRKKTSTTPALSLEGNDTVTLGFDGWSNSGVTSYTNKDGSVTATWKKILGAQGYILERYSNKTGEYVQIGTLPASTTTYTFKATEETDWDNEYRLYVYSGNTYDAEYFYPSVIKVAAPGSVKAVAGTDSITVSWAPVTGASYYRVYRSTRLGAYNPNTDSYSYLYGGTSLQVQTKAGTLSADGTYYTESPTYTTEIPASVTSVKDGYIGYPYLGWDSAAQKSAVKTADVQKAPAVGIRYYYYVRAYAANGEEIDYSSLYSKPGNAMITSVTVGKPTISSVTAGKKKATVKWKKVTGASKYYIYYSTKKSSGYKLAGITTSRKLAVTGLTSGKKYYFKVKACRSNEAGADVYSALSAAKSKKVK